MTWLESGVSSVGLRPASVHGVGRDQGLMSTPTTAIVAALLGRPYRISLGGRALFQYVEDTAQAFIMASRASQPGVHDVNLGGEAVHVSEFTDAIVETVPAADDLITSAETSLSFPDEFDLTGLDALGPVPVTSLRDGVAATARLFEGLRDAGRLDPVEHGLAS